MNEQVHQSRVSPPRSRVVTPQSITQPHKALPPRPDYHLKTAGREGDGETRSAPDAVNHATVNPGYRPVDNAANQSLENQRVPAFYYSLQQVPRSYVSQQREQRDVPVRKAGPMVEERLFGTSPKSSRTSSEEKSKAKSRRKCGGFREQLKYWKQDTWLTDIGSWLFSVASLAAVIVVLLEYDGQPLPNWPYNITLNTLVSLFVTLSTTALMNPVSEGISQLKWLWFAKGNKKVADLELFDQASRGAVGGLSLIFSSTGKSISSLGVIITILVLAANTFTQQSISYVERLVPDLTHEAPIMPRATYYDAHDTSRNSIVPSDATIDMATEAAIYDGLLTGNITLQPLRPSCPTGNCTWSEYKTLGVCGYVANVTDRVLVTYLDTSTQHIVRAKLPGLEPLVIDYGSSFMIQSTPTLRNLPNGVPVQNSHSQAFKEAVNNTMADFFVMFMNNYGQVQAMEASLQYCVQTMESRVTYGKPFTNVKSVNTDFKWNKQGDAMSIVMPETGENFTVGYLLYNAAGPYMRDLFTGTVVSTVDTSSPYNTTAIKAVYSSFGTSEDQNTYFDTLIANVATSLTNSFRSNGIADFPKYGQAHVVQAHVHVSWVWISLLIAVEVASFVFMISVIVITYRKGCSKWKSSTLALLQALEPAARSSDMIGLRTNVEMKEKAKNVRLDLKESGDIWTLKRSSREGENQARWR